MKPEFVVTPAMKARLVAYKNAEDVKPVRKVWAVGRFLRDFKVWATEWRAQ